MLWGIVNAILGALGSITWKKSLDLSRVSADYFKFLGMPIAVLIGLVFVAMGKVSWDFPPMIWALIVFLAICNLISTHVSQSIYKEEKVSALLPFQNISSVLTIIIAYILFRDTSLASFLVAIVTMITIFAFSFDFRQFTLPKNIVAVLGVNALGAVRSLVTAYVVARTTSIGFFSISSFLITIFLLYPLIKNRSWHEIPLGSKAFYGYRTASAVTGQVACCIGFFLLEKLGLITSTLLGFLSLGATLAFGYFILHDVPKKKDVISVAIVSLLVFLGMYLK